MNKPKLSAEQIVSKMRDEKGITFNHITEKDAICFLQEKNNYYRLASYRKNYDKKLFGEEKGKYIDLDFAYLVDLSIIDMHLRSLIFQMCLDVEHDLKVRLINDITDDATEDGYALVVNFLEKNTNIQEDILRKRYSTYVGDLINKFFTFETHQNANGKEIIDKIEIRCPIWAFVEILSFGDFIKLYSAYYNVDCPVQMSLLNPIKSLRNACAHNNCLINNLRSGKTKPSLTISSFIAKVSTTSRDERRKYLSKRPVFEFCCLLMAYDNVVSADVKKHRYEELNALINERMKKHSQYYQNQQILSSTYNFVKKVVDFLL